MHFIDIIIYFSQLVSKSSRKIPSLQISTLTRKSRYATLLLTLLFCDFATLWLCCFVTLLFCDFATLWLCCFVTLLLCDSATLWLCCWLCYFVFATLWLCYFLTLLLCDFAVLLFCDCYFWHWTRLSCNWQACLWTFYTWKLIHLMHPVICQMSLFDLSTCHTHWHYCLQQEITPDSLKSKTYAAKKKEWCFRPIRFCAVRLCWIGDKLCAWTIACCPRWLVD